MNYIDDFNKYVEEIQNEHKNLISQLSEVDSAQDDILHFLELAPCNAAIMMKATKKLKEIRNQRREIKNKLAVIDKIHARIGSSNLTYKEPSIYTCKTDVLSCISNIKPDNFRMNGEKK